MSSDDDVDPLNAGRDRPKLILVNHRGASREQPQATTNQVPAGGVYTTGDAAVETSDNEELAVDLLCNDHPIG